MFYNRIGNDLTIQWPIEVEGVQDLSTLDMTIYVVCNRFRKPMTYTIDGEGVVEFTFWGIDQRVLGTYDLELVLNEGEHGQVIFDNKNAFTLFR